MEVRGQQPTSPHPAQQRFEEARAEVARASRDKVRRARQALADFARRRLESVRAEPRQSAQENRADHVELSAAAREAAPADEARAVRVAELKAEHAQGRLDTPEQIERAAQRILGA